MSLPIFKDSSQPFQLMQSRWAAELNPIIQNPSTNPRILKGVVLASGSNVINTGLVLPLQGWVVSDINAAVTIYRSSAKVPLTLTLTASGAATVDLMVW